MFLFLSFFYILINIIKIIVSYLERANNPPNTKMKDLFMAKFLWYLSTFLLLIEWINN